MNSEICLIGTKVRFNMPWNTMLHGETGIVVAREASDEALVRFDTHKPDFDQYEDTRSGTVTVDPDYLDTL